MLIDFTSYINSLSPELFFGAISLLSLSLLVITLIYKQISLNKQLKQLLSTFTQGHVQQLDLIDKLKESTAVGFEKNKGEISLALGKVLAESQQQFMQQLADTRFNILETLAQQNQAQHQSMSEFRDKFSQRIDTSLKLNTDSLNKMFHDLRQSTDVHMKEINDRVELRLRKGFEQTNIIFSDIRERLTQIDQAQQRISDLSNNVISLQKTLDNKGARGAFGEVQLMDIVKDMIPEKHCAFQQVLSNDKRPDCIVFLPEPTKQLIIDAKFPLENYKLMCDNEIPKAQQQIAARQFKQDIKKHIKDIAEKYIIPGETADGAVMFIPSEAVFSEIHAHHPDLVQHAQLMRVWLTSPSTLMALLTTIRVVLADDERSRQAKIIHQHLNALSIEFNRFAKRMDDLGKHINLAHEDVSKINISTKKITQKFEQIERADFESIE